MPARGSHVGTILVPALEPVDLAGESLPAELTALRAVGLVLAAADRRLRDLAPALAAQRRRPDPARRRRSAWRSSPAPSSLDALLSRLLLREGQRRPHPRPRRLRDLRSCSCSSCARSRRRRAITRELSAVLEGLAWEEFRQARPAGALPRTRSRSLDPRLQRGREHRLRPRPDPGRGLRRRDRGAGRRRRLARRHRRRRRRARRRRRPPRDQPRRRRRAAHRLPADGRLGRRRSSSPSTPTASTCPSEMERLVEAGARRRGRRRPRLARARPRRAATTSPASSGSSSSTGSSRSSPAPRSPTAPTATAPCAPTVLPQLVLRQEQFHTSEFMIEAIKRGIPAKEVPVTVDQRLHGHSKKPAVVRYGARLRERDRPDLAAVAPLPRPRADLRGVRQVEVRCRSGGRPGRRA